MVKYKRKISSTQRDKYYISAASQLKKAGIISKQAKLHGGHYISKSVLKKVKEYQHAADLKYKAVKVPKKVAEAAKARGWQVVGGNKVIGPATPTFTNRIKKGLLTGVKPVKGGMMEEVELPHTVYDMQTLVEQLESGIDSLKMPNEYFAFKYKGNESYRILRDSDALIKYLRDYKPSSPIYQAMTKPEEYQEEFENFSIVRLHINDQQKLIRGPSQRKRDRKAAGIKPERRHDNRPSLAEKLAMMPASRANRIRKKRAEKAVETRNKILSDPVKAAAYREAAKKRAKDSRDRRKK